MPVQTNWEFAPAPTIDIPFYSKGIQTSEPWSPQQQKQSTDGFSDSDPDGSPSARTSPRSTRLSRREREREEELRQKLREEIEKELKAVRDAASIGAGPQSAQSFPTRALTGEELNAITASDGFLDFVQRSSKIIERALDEEYDVLADYAMDGVVGVDDDEDEGYASSRGKKGRGIKEIVRFYDERWSKKRIISDLDFSPKAGIFIHPRSPKANHHPSSPNFFSHHTPRILPLRKTLPGSFKFGTHISIPAQNTRSTAPPISSPPASPPSTPLSS